MEQIEKSILISSRLKEKDHVKLREEANRRMLTISELVRSILEQRVGNGGREYEERLVRIEAMLQDIVKTLKKIYYHSTRASLALISEYRVAHGDKEAEKIAKAIMEEVARYSNYLKESGKDVLHEPNTTF
jgi:hypothetical protein